MNPHNLIVECEFLGVSVKLEKGNIKLIGQPAAVKNAAEIARPYKAELIAYLSGLDQFKFDEAKADITNGHPAPDIHRVNNMAWEFMHQDGLNFEDAITKAAEIVTKCDVAECEKSYEDAMELFRKLKQG
jgi:hypothetical protein